ASSRPHREHGYQTQGILETVATLPAGWDSAHAIRLGNKPFAELGANSEALSGSQVDSPCSLPSDPRIGPGNVAIVSNSWGFCSGRAGSTRRRPRKLWTTIFPAPRSA